jgi:DNA repair protein RadC
MDTEHGPRERLRDEGVERLSDAELVALVLGTGTVREPVSVLAARLIDEGRGLHGLARLGVGALATRNGVGASKAARIVAAIELGRRAAKTIDRGDRIGTSRDVFERVAARIADADVEHFVVLPLDARMRVLAVVSVARGTVSACPVSPADAFRAVLREAAVAVVFAHNHPSGDPDPSAEDLVLTERLVAAGDVLGIKVLDHVIVARERYFSFLDAGLLRSPTR